MDENRRLLCAKNARNRGNAHQFLNLHEVRILVGQFRCSPGFPRKSLLVRDAQIPEESFRSDVHPKPDRS
jgi:hypothetical protein